MRVAIYGEPPAHSLDYWRITVSQSHSVSVVLWLDDRVPGMGDVKLCVDCPVQRGDIWRVHCDEIEEEKRICRSFNLTVFFISLSFL